jgi:hypothetical protein
MQKLTASGNMLDSSRPLDTRINVALTFRGPVCRCSAAGVMISAMATTARLDRYEVETLLADGELLAKSLIEHRDQLESEERLDPRQHHPAFL